MNMSPFKNVVKPKSKFAVQKALDELNATTKKILNQELGLGDV